MDEDSKREPPRGFWESAKHGWEIVSTPDGAHTVHQLLGSIVIAFAAAVVLTLWRPDVALSVAQVGSFDIQLGWGIVGTGLLGMYKLFHELGRRTVLDREHFDESEAGLLSADHTVWLAHAAWISAGAVVTIAVAVLLYQVMRRGDASEAVIVVGMAAVLTGPWLGVAKSMREWYFPSES